MYVCMCVGMYVGMYVCTGVDPEAGLTRLRAPPPKNFHILITEAYIGSYPQWGRWWAQLTKKLASITLNR